MEKSADWYWEDRCLIPIAGALYDTETHISSVTHRKQFQLPALLFPLWKQDIWCSPFHSSPIRTSPIRIQVLAQVLSSWAPANQILRRGTSQHTVAASV